MAGLDRGIRVLIGVLAAVLFFGKIVTGTLGIILLVVGLILAATAVINFCPIYAALGIRTNKADS